MERPSKRPRLHLFDSLPADQDLDSARRTNDLSLKSRFEAIFEKYSQDFSAIGDEIDLVSGKVVVNNGHLESLASETDPGLPSQSRNSLTATGRGKSILRAMTVAPEESDYDDSGADEVMQSIETFADSAALQEGYYTSESEDDLFPEVRRAPVDLRNEVLEDVGRTPGCQLSDSDSDSLFERGASPDNLKEESDVETEPHDVLSNETKKRKSISGSIERTSLSAREMSDDRILERYGSVMGREVLDLLENRGKLAEERIEPAWRIPIVITPPPEALQTVRPNASHPTAIPAPQSPPRVPSPQHGQSLWHVPDSHIIQRIFDRHESVPSVPSMREESEDPLQADSSDEKEHTTGGRLNVDETRERDARSYSRDTPSGFEEIGELQIDFRDVARVRDIACLGVCPYCDIQFSCRSGVMAHWDRWLRKAEEQREEDDPHDCDLITFVRGSVVRRIRKPRLLLCDFRAIVELHEGAGMTLDEVAQSGALRTRKTGEQLEEVYCQHRDPPSSRQISAGQTRWTGEEEELLRQLMEKDRMTMTSMKTCLPGKTVLDVGNKLADEYLRALGNLQQGTRSNEEEQLLEAAQIRRCRQESTHGSIPVTHIKTEDSEDDLFDT